MNIEENIITVFIVAGSAIVRAGLESVVQTNDEFVVTGSAAEISVAPSNFSAGQGVDILLVNVEREKDFDDLLEFISDGLEENNLPATIVLFSLELLNSENLIKALKGGVRGMLPHNASADEISAIVNSAAAGLFSFSPESAEEFLSLFVETDLSASPVENNKQSFEDEMIETLTPREAEILEMLTDGASNKSIAYQLNISEHTVKFHVASIFGKLGVNTRTEAVTQSLRRGLILL